MTALIDAVYFILRYGPFWSIPLMLIFLQFGYLYWLKEYKLAYLILFAGAGVCFVFTLFYIFAGGPDGSAHYFTSLLRLFGL